MASPPKQHKEVAKHLNTLIGGDVKICIYRDSNGNRPVPVGTFGTGKNRFHSTIGAFDSPKELPVGLFEFATMGSAAWLPNALTSSIYWMKDRACEHWPLVCEDVIRDNVKSKFRHMAYIPSVAALVLSDGRTVRWLLGVPITDQKLTIGSDEVMKEALNIFPSWLFKANA